MHVPARLIPDYCIVEANKKEPEDAAASSSERLNQSNAIS
jgi:hypothetical protein